MTLSELKVFLSGLLVLMVLVLYRPVLVGNPTLSFDDSSLLDPISSVHHFTDYIQAWDEGKIFDIQPVRDFSFWIDFQLSQFGYRTFHLTNVLLWIILLLLFKETLDLIFRSQTSKKTNWFLVFYLALHPVSVNTVAWISARKHLLSGLFILGATFLVLQWVFQRPQEGLESPAGQDSRLRMSFSRGLSIVFLFALALMSQPINCLWPVWVFSVLFFCRRDSLNLQSSQGRSGWSLLAILALVSASVVWLNIDYYYSSRFGFNVFSPKDWLEGDNISTKLAALGRYFFQMLVPVVPSVTSYYPGHWAGIAGLIILPFFSWLCFKILKVKEWILPAVFILLPLVTVTAKMTSVFAIDTYLFSPLLGWVVLVGFLIRAIPLNKFGRVAVACVFAVQAVITGVQANSWGNEDRLYERAAQMEETPFTLNLYGHSLYRLGHYGEALEIAIRIYDWGMSGRIGMDLLVVSLVAHQGLDWKTKYKILMDHPMDTELFVFYKAVILVQLDRWDEALVEYAFLVEEGLKKGLKNLQLPQEQLLKDIGFVCEKRALEACSELLPKLEILRKSIKK